MAHGKSIWHRLSLTGRALVTLPGSCQMHVCDFTVKCLVTQSAVVAYKQAKQAELAPVPYNSFKSRQGDMLQTRLTALDLIGFAAGDERPRQFVHMPEAELDQELIAIKV